MGNEWKGFLSLFLCMSVGVHVPGTYDLLHSNSEHTCNEDHRHQYFSALGICLTSGIDHLPKIKHIPNSL